MLMRAVLMGLLCCSVVYAQTSDEVAMKQRMADDGRAALTTPVMEEVLVTGEQPGPGLWKVSKGDHVMWVLGTYGPLPNKMTWRSKQVEATVAQSQVYLASASAKADIGFFKSLTLLPSLIGVRDNPNDAQLKDILPPDLYARWHVLKEKYIGSSNSVEKWRPMFAAQELYSKAIDKAGMDSSRDVRDAMEKLTKKTKIKLVTPIVEVSIEKPRAAIKEFKKGSMDDVQCFAKTIERLETDLDLMRARANAWATGNVEALRKMTHIDQATACIEAMMTAQVVQERGLQDLPNRMEMAWLAAAEEAIAHNLSTFAVLSIDNIFKTDGYLAKLRERGYQVEEPQ